MEETWHPARLIPVAGIKGQEEQERRATSTLLAVMGCTRVRSCAVVRTGRAARADPSLRRDPATRRRREALDPRRGNRRRAGQAAVACPRGGQDGEGATDGRAG